MCWADHRTCEAKTTKIWPWIWPHFMTRCGKVVIEITAAFCKHWGLRIASHFPCCLGEWILIKKTGARLEMDSWGTLKRRPFSPTGTIEGFSLQEMERDGTSSNVTFFQVFPHFPRGTVEPWNPRGWWGFGATCSTRPSTLPNRSGTRVECLEMVMLLGINHPPNPSFYGWYK